MPISDEVRVIGPVPTDLPAAKLHELEGVYRIGANALRRINGLIV
jgi:hypothetical protein